jgi:hypothetical protein
MLARVIPPPPTRPTWGGLAASVPAVCPFHGCAIRHIRCIAGGDDRRPVADVIFECGRTLSAVTGAVG